MNPYCDSLVWFVFILEIIPRTISWLENTSLKLIKFIAQSYLFTLSIYNNFFRHLAYKSLLSEFWCYNELYYVVFQSSFSHPAVWYVFYKSHFSGSTFFWAWFQGPGPGSGSRFCMIVLYACSPVNVLHIFRTVSHKITSRGLLPNIVTNKREGR